MDITLQVYKFELLRHIHENSFATCSNTAMSFDIRAYVSSFMDLYLLVQSELVTSPNYASQISADYCGSHVIPRVTRF